MAQNTVKVYQHEAPFDSGLLSVGSIHKIHYDQYGKKDGKPVVFLHGGPGGSCSIKNTVFFDPAVYRVILFDQRGGGKSLPQGEIRENSAPHTVSDIEALRKHFGIKRWHVFGASWGTTVALMYAQTHPEAVSSIVLRGVSFWEALDKINLNAAYERTRLFNPEMYDELIDQLSEEERKDIAASYCKRFDSKDRAVRLAAMKTYDKWAGLMSKLAPKRDEGDITMSEEEERGMVASIAIENHYHAHHLWLKEMDYLSPAKVEGIKHIPCYIVNGRYDLICPPIAAWKIHKKLPKSKVYMIDDAGHSAAEPNTRRKLVEICDELASLPI